MNDMNLRLNLQGEELEIILDALKEYAEKYSNKRINAIKSGDNKLYLEYSQKKSYAWQAYSHIRKAVRQEDMGEDE